MPERAIRDRVVVIGGGLTGLAVAHRLATAPLAGLARPEVLVYESRPRLGGAIWTNRRDGFLLEGGADSFITNKPWGVDLCRELGLADELIGTDPGRRRSFVVRDGGLVPAPDGFVLLAPTKLLPILTSPIFSWRGKMRILAEPFVPRKRDEADESLAAFVKRRLGREALDRLVQPMVGGIYTADPNDLSMAATLPHFAAMEREQGGLLRGAKRLARGDRHASGARYGLFATLRDGMEALPRALARSLPAGSVRTSAQVRRVIRPDPAGPWRVESLDGPAIEASAVVLASEAHASARLVDSLDPDLAVHLRSIPYASSIVASVAYRRDAVAHALDGFGAVVPLAEGRSILAVSFTSIKFAGRAPADCVLFRVFLGGAAQPELFDLDDEALSAIVKRELSELLGAKGEPLLLEIGRHSRAMPQYTVGHLDRVAAIRCRVAAHPGLALAGNAFGGVGIPDCIRSAREAADAVLAGLAEAARRSAVA